MALHPLVKQSADLAIELDSKGVSTDLICNAINLVTVLPDNQAIESALNELEQIAHSQEEISDAWWLHKTTEVYRKYKAR